MTEYSLLSIYALKGLIAGISGLGIAIIESDRVSRDMIFANVSGSVTATFLISAIREKFWLMGEYVILLSGMLLTAFAVIAVVNFLRNAEEKNQFMISAGLFVSALFGVIIGFDMIVLSFVAFMTIMLFSYVGRQFVKK